MNKPDSKKDHYNEEAARSPLSRLKYNRWYHRAAMNTEDDQSTEIRLVDLLHDLWAARKFIAGGALLGILCATLFWFTALPHYRAGVILSPAEPMSGANASTLFSNEGFSALNFLIQRAGVSGNSDFARFKAVYTGPEVAGKLLKDKNILEGLTKDKSFVFSSPQENWTPAKFSEYLKRRVTLDSVNAQGMREMHYRHTNPDFAVYLLEALHKTADDSIRHKIREATEERILYLRENLTTTAHPEHRRALTDLLLEQERLRMLVSIDQPYAAGIIEAPAASPRPSWPDVPLLFVLLALAGAFAGFISHEARKPHVRRA